MSDCCQPCPEVQTVNIPGTPGDQGDPGDDGIDGVNAFTQTTGDFDTPLIGQNVTVDVVNSTWMTIGQIIAVQGPANFQVISKPTATSVIVEFMGYTGDVAEGATISTGATVSPSGVQGPDQTLLPTISSYAVGGSQVLTDTPVQGLALSVTLPAAKTYLLIFTGRFDFSVATFPASADLTAKLRRTNNTAGDIPNAIIKGATGVQTTESGTMPFPGALAVIYAATAGDQIQLFVSLSVTPYAGAVNMAEGSILALPLF